MGNAPSQMALEIGQTPKLAELALRAPLPVEVHEALDSSTRAMFVGEGSSYHVALAAQELSRRYGLVADALSPVQYRVAEGGWRAMSTVTFCISQSGESKHTLAAARHARSTGGFVVAVTNSPSSSLARETDVTLNVGAGPETAVAATKTVSLSAITLALVIAAVVRDDALTAALGRMPRRLEEALAASVGVDLERFTYADAAEVIGSGPDAPVARETVLKLAEACEVRANAHDHSGVHHGPKALFRKLTPALLFVPHEYGLPLEWRQPVLESAAKLVPLGADVIAVGASPGDLPRARELLLSPTGHPSVDALVNLVAMQCLVEQLARWRGCDPDSPPTLSKVCLE